MAIVLKSGLLILNIEIPSEVYNGSRFDHSGNISQITFDGKWTFCTCELINGFDPRQNGQGLYNEFGINLPVGYDDCPIGQKFPKIGVGLLTKKGNSAYDFFSPYETEFFKISVENDISQVKFTVLPEDCRGYSVKLVKRISLSGDSFSIQYELENTGSRRIVTNEYCHNFISINNSSVDTNYTLRIPGEITDISSMFEAVNPEKAVSLNANTMSFRFTPGKDFFFSPLTEFHNTRGEWILAHKDHGIMIKERTDFTPEIMNVWGSGHVISPELFIKIDIMPGETLRWQRNYEFYHL